MKNQERKEDTFGNKIIAALLVVFMLVCICTDTAEFSPMLGVTIIVVILMLSPKNLLM